MVADFYKIVVQTQFSYHFKGQTSMFQLGLKTSQNTSHRKRNYEKHKLPRISNCPEFRRFRHICIRTLKGLKHKTRHKNIQLIVSQQTSHTVILIETRKNTAYETKFESRHEETRFLPSQRAQISCAVSVQLISALVFASRIVQFLPYLYPKFQDSCFLL